MAIVTGLLCKPILRLMDTPEDILHSAYLYIDIIFWGIPATYLLQYAIQHDSGCGRQ